MNEKVLSLDSVPDAIASDRDGKEEALRLVANIAPPSRAAAFLSRVARKIDTGSGHGRKPLDYLRLMAMGPSDWVGPFGGPQGASVAVALFLEERRDRFAAWLEPHGVDPAPCHRWIDERVGLFRVAQVIVDGHRQANAVCET